MPTMSAIEIKAAADHYGIDMEEAMRAANWQADRPTGKRTPAQAAQWLAETTGLQR